MERVTKKVDGVWTALCKYESSPFPVVTQEIIDRLAAYEDTGLAPEEVQIQKEAMESMGWFGKMFQRYKGDPRGPIGTLGTTLGKSLVVLNVESAKNRQPVKDADGNTWLPMLLDEFESMADFIERVQDWIPVEERLPDKPGHYLVCTSVNYWHGGCMDKNGVSSNTGTTDGYVGTTLSVLDCFYDTTGDWNRVCNKHVTHWMNIPAPPGAVAKNETTESNEPLTPEELRKMLGEPVWTVGVSYTNDGKWAMWDIVEKADDEGVDFGYSTEGREWWNYNLRGNNGKLLNCAWACYRRPPEGEEES